VLSACFTRRGTHRPPSYYRRGDHQVREAAVALRGTADTPVAVSHAVAVTLIHIVPAVAITLALLSPPRARRSHPTSSATAPERVTVAASVETPFDALPTMT
jgi:hypothetical protein